MNAVVTGVCPADVSARESGGVTEVEYRVRDSLREAVSLHRHSWMEIKLITGGSATLRTGKGSFSMSRGSLLFLRAERAHGWSLKEQDAPLSYYHARIAPPVLSGRCAELLQCAGDAPPIRLSREEYSAALSVFGKMQRVYAARRPGYEAAVGSLAEGLAVLFWRNRLADGERDADGVVAKAVAYIEKHYAERVSLSDAARYVCLSPTYFSTLFARAAGVNFSDYLRTYRLTQAKRLLRTPGASVSSVASEVGFHSAAYFINSFSDVFGMTPGEYRRDDPS